LKAEEVNAMSRIVITGPGVWVHKVDIDEVTAKDLLKSGKIGKKDLDKYEEQMDGYGLGFTRAATVVLDDQPLGYLGSLLDEGSDTPGFNELIAQLDGGMVLDLKNSFVRKDNMEGVFVDAEISDYDFMDNPGGKKRFISDLVENIIVENGKFISLEEWHGEDISSGEPLTISSEYFVVCDGDRQSIKTPKSSAKKDPRLNDPKYEGLDKKILSQFDLSHPVEAKLTDSGSLVYTGLSKKTGGNMTVTTHGERS
jgi:hypothetical protein